MLELPPQIASKEEAEIISEAGKATLIASGSFMSANFVISWLLSASLSLIWNMLNSLQISVHAPMFGKLKFPANAMILNQSLITIANFSLFATEEEIDPLIYYLPEDEAFNINFDQCGYGAKLLLLNISMVVWMLTVNIAFMLILGLTWLINRRTGKLVSCKGKLSGYFFWNGLIRLFMEIFFEVAFASSLNLYIVDWDTPFAAVKFSNILSLLFFITSIVISLLLIVFYAKNLGRVDDESFDSRFGAGLEGTNLKKANDRWSILVYLVFFLGRRIAFIASVILLDHFLWA